MKRILICLVLLTCIFSESSLAQGEASDGTAKEDVLRELENILKKLDPCSYRAEMLFKEFGGDTFQARNFIVDYRSNPNNPLYGYDYEITEFLDQDTFTMMTLNTSLYIIDAKGKFVSERKLPDEIDLSSYFESMRSFCIINEVFQRFLHATPNEVSVVDSNNNYYLWRKMNALADVHLVINKETLLPSMWSSIIRGYDFDLTQTQEVHFEFGQNDDLLPNGAFAIEKYLSAGYEYTISKPDTSTKQPVVRSLSSENQQLLWNYPFVLPEGDTVIIQNRTAKYILLDFWYASCLPCLSAMPEVSRLAETYSGAGLEVFGINCFDMGIKENLAVKMKERNIQIPLLFGARDLIKTLGIRSFPSYYLITPDSNIVFIDGGIDGVKQAMAGIFNRN